jgi:hypothetical protein
MPVLFPSRQPSPTSAEGQVDYRSEHIYSAGVFAHGASSVLSTFLTAKGQAIPEQKGAAVTATTAAHQMQYSDTTTNVVQSGQMGSTIGEASITDIGITFEQAGFTPSGASAGAQLTYGAGAQEFSELAFKTSLELKIGNKPQIKGPSFLFPALGGISGAVSNTGTATCVAFLSNGVGGRALDFPLPLSRTDTIEGVLGVTAPNASLTFSVTTGIGQPVLAWVGLKVITAADVR